MKKIQYNGSSKILKGLASKINTIIDKLIVDVKVNGTSVVTVNEDGEREADIDLSLADQNVKQSPTTDNKDYRVLLSKSDNDTEETDIARKNTSLKYNPSTGNLQATKLNGNTIPSGSDTIALTSDITSAINDLDVTGASNIGAGKTIKTWSETNGKVSITTQDISITKSQISDFPTIPTVNDGKLTINQNGTLKGEFTANDSDDVTVDLTDTTYESKAAVSGGTAVSLVTTGEKYTWNNNRAVAEIRLTNEDLNDVTYPGFYYAAGGNTVTNKPTGYNNFGLEVIHNASGSQYVQIISNENGSYRRIKKADSTWTSWAEDKFTDENVKQAILAQTDTGWHKVIIGGTSLSETTDKVYIVNGLSYRPSTGTFSVDSADGVANTARTNIVKIGNNKTKATANHVEGRIDLYGENGGYSTLKFNTASTSHRTHTLPNKDGTIATEEDTAVALQLASDADLNDIKTVGFYYAPSGNSIANKPTGFNQFGLFVIRSATSANYYKQTLIRPNTDGEEWVRTCTNGTWSAWTQNLFTDENVKQTAKTDDVDYRVLLSSSANDTEETGGVNKNTNLKYNPDTTILTSPKLNVTSTINASGTADNKPALMIGPVTGAHLELDQNELMAKGSDTTTSTLHLNADGSNVTINNNSQSITLGNGAIDIKNGGSSTAYPIKVNLNQRGAHETVGEDIKPIVVYYQTKDSNGGTQNRTSYPFAVIGNNATNTNNTGVRLGSHNGTTIVGAGESSITFANGQRKYNDENLYLTADGSVNIYQGLDNNSTTYTSHIKFPKHLAHNADNPINEFVAAYQRNCIVGNDSAVSSTKRWYLVGGMIITEANTDYSCMFTVNNTFSNNLDANECAGLLYLHFRTNSSVEHQTASMKFVANVGFNPQHFELVWSISDSNTYVSYQLYTYIDVRYMRRRFTELSGGYRLPSSDYPSNGDYKFIMLDTTTAQSDAEVMETATGRIYAT